MVLVYFLQRNMTLVFLKNFKSEFPIMKDKFLNKKKNSLLVFYSPCLVKLVLFILNWCKYSFVITESSLYLCGS